jgi:hypothetical protein
MAKPKKTYGVKYGIVITKPWNKQMYEHNDKVSVEMKHNIFDALSKVYDDALQYEDDTELKKVARQICYYGHGDGFEPDGIFEDAESELDNMPNYQLHEVYADMEKDKLVPELEEYLIGYDK